MEKTWIEIDLQVPGQWIDLVCSLFQEIGSTGVFVEERELDTFEPPDPAEPYLPVCSIRAYFPNTHELSSLKAEIAEKLKELSRFTPQWIPGPVEPVLVKDENWGEKWKQHFQAFRVGRRLVVSPSWEKIAPQAEDFIIRLDPGMAFGTGGHPTTRLCLESLVEFFDSASPPKNVLDVGTGSGILAMAAAALGANSVLATDIDPDAAQIARDNIKANRLSCLIEVRCDILEKIEGSFDMILANIFAEELMRLAPHFLRLLAADGTLILSGVLKEKAGAVESCFLAAPLVEIANRQREEWCCLVYRRN
ncbi:MAG: 50S ribosomal protein L11 methyltransferase [Deltaproteobacteria bacterium]|nr:50S ribosomal protein L11 methyltransferase [Deltaproteobacteria bacterium]